MLCFSCTKIHDRADQKLFWRGPEIFRRGRSLVRFPPPIRFAPPHITAQFSKCTPLLFLGEMSGTSWNPQPLVVSQKYCRYKLEAYLGRNRRRTAAQNWRCIAAIPLFQSLEASKARRYKWWAYCGTNWRCIAVLLRQVVQVDYYIRADFWAGDPTKHFSVKKKGVFSEEGGGIQ